MTLLTLMYLSMMLTTCCFTQSTVKQIKENMKSYAKGYVIQYYVPYVNIQPDEHKMKLLKHLEDNLLLITSTEDKEEMDGMDTLVKSGIQVSTDVEDNLGPKIRSLSSKVDSNDGLLVSNPQNLMKAVSRDVENSLENKIRSLSAKVDSNDGLLVSNPQNLMRAVSRDVENSLENKIRSLSAQVDSNDGLLVSNPHNLMRAVSRDVEDSLENKIRSLSAKVDSNDGLLVSNPQNLMRAVSRDVEDSLENKIRSLSAKVDSNDGLLVSNPQNLMRAVSRDVENSLENKIRSLSAKVDSNDGLLVSNPQNLMRAVSRDVENSLENKIRSLSAKVDSNDGLLVSNPQNLMRAVSRDVENSLENKIRSLSAKVDSNDGLLVSNPQNLMRAVSRDVENSLTDVIEAIIEQLHKNMTGDAQLYNVLKEALLSWFQYHAEHDDMQLHNLDLENLINWLTLVHNSRRNVSKEEESFYTHWNTSLPILRDTLLFADTVKPLSTYISLSLMGLTDSFMNIYWPFRRDINLMNQKLAVKGFRGTDVSESDAKKAFFDEIRKIQPIHLPVKKNEIVLIFDDEDIADWLNVTGVMSLSPSYMASKKHIFTGEEQRRISTTAHAALRMINNTHPELFDAMSQMISCIAFYKQEHKVNLAGGVRSALGLFWMDPSVGREWSVPFMAEQIVHEYTHNALNYAEFVHGTYNDKSTLGKAEVKSAIRLVPRPYDKSLHAAYVSAGLVTFHSRTGYLERAAQLVETLPQAVRDLATVEAEKHVLDGSGRAIVKFLTDYMYLTRL
ncbi:uncharacterized protein [Haliotis cracherodii]|uniref:uncharacterized protein n=1 Tax=Haliotis cracherodii TaxID=6455 RepID=UPI0039EA6354